MPVFIDPLMPCVQNAKWRWDNSCHMFCMPGELELLHKFAWSIGLRRDWFQHEKRLPHYDLNASRRAIAVRWGATEVDHKKVVATIHLWREAGESGWISTPIAVPDEPRKPIPQPKKRRCKGVETLKQTELF